MLLQRGATAVVAVDVGTNQLAHKLRVDPRVTSIEQTNARTLDVATLPFRPDLVVCDVSFISLTLVLPTLVAAAGPGGRPIVALVKPQFEVGKGEVGKGGVVREPAKRQAAVDKCVAAARALGCDGGGRHRVADHRPGRQRGVPALRAHAAFDVTSASADTDERWPPASPSASAAATPAATSTPARACSPTRSPRASAAASA